MAGGPAKKFYTPSWKSAGANNPPKHSKAQTYFSVCRLIVIILLSRLFTQKGFFAPAAIQKNKWLHSDHGIPSNRMWRLRIFGISAQKNAHGFSKAKLQNCWFSPRQRGWRLKFIFRSLDINHRVVGAPLDTTFGWRYWMITTFSPEISPHNL